MKVGGVNGGFGLGVLEYVGMVLIIGSGSVII